ncbi:MAG: hypothetical protein ACI80F_002363 [Natronomonas sp.]|jgi:hypothetical protein|uniref:hypothetical protein n=1 Tax=Natronomonas sp. TaxID=2184060 RepID=UPI003988BE85
MSDESDKPRNMRDRVGMWYFSDSLSKKSIGVWVKFLFEYLVVAIPLFPVFFAVALVFDELLLVPRPVPNSIWIYWLSVSLSVLSIVWCFSLAGLEVEPSELEETEQASLEEATQGG